MPIVETTRRMLAITKGKIYNLISPIGWAKSQGVKIGHNCRLINVTFGSEPYLVTLGNHVSATNVAFVTHDGGVWVFRDRYPDINVVAPIKVGNNVFFGTGVIVLPGVTIGDNVVIAAGAVVSKDIPSDCIAAGVPAKVIRSLAEYWNSSKQKSIPIKQMTWRQKKEYLLKHFGLERKTR